MKKIISLFLFVCVLASCSDTFSTSYESYDEIVLDKAIERGWIPKIIPKSAYNIKETHDLDINTGKGSFQFRNIDETVFRKQLGMILKNKTKDSLIKKYALPKGDVYQWKNFIFSIDWVSYRAEFRLVGVPT